jgi:hypothetical protein
MESNSFYLLWPGNPVLSIVVWVALSVVVLYLARMYVHRLISSLTHLFHNAMRLAARSVMQAERRLERRNREVLLAAGAEAAEHKLEREFQRLNEVVTRDLQAYPAMHRSMSDTITVVDDDYRRSSESPPSPPEWLEAIEAVSKIPSTGDTPVANMLGEINKSLDKHHKTTMEEYRKASATRHSLLKKMMPYWRKMSTTLETVDKTMRGIMDRSEHIDRKMEDYQAILARTDKAVRTLSSSSLTQFSIAGIVLLIALGGAIVNFNLIALPMSEMVGGGTYLGPFKMSNVAAMVIILLEATAGIFLMEAMQITHLFPIIGNMVEKKRVRFMWTSFVILFVLASIEASLAFMRDIIVVNKQALLQTLSNVENEAPTTYSWIPMVGQMVMGFVIPFLLAFVAIPFESFVHSSRTVLGVVLTGLMRLMAFSLRLAGNIVLYAGNVIIQLYDLMAFPLLWLEHVLRARGKHESSGKRLEETVKEDTLK